MRTQGMVVAAAAAAVTLLRGFALSPLAGGPWTSLRMRGRMASGDGPMMEMGAARYERAAGRGSSVIVFAGGEGAAGPQTLDAVPSDRPRPHDAKQPRAGDTQQQRRGVHL